MECPKDSTAFAKLGSANRTLTQAEYKATLRASLTLNSTQRLRRVMFAIILALLKMGSSYGGQILRSSKMKRYLR